MVKNLMGKIEKGKWGNRKWKKERYGDFENSEEGMI